MTFELKDYRKGTKKIVSVIHSNDLLAKSHNRIHNTLYVIFCKLYSVKFFLIFSYYYQTKLVSL